MDNLWIDKKAEVCENDLHLGVYTSNLLGENDELVLDGGGNVSLKSEDILYITKDGCDLAVAKTDSFVALYRDSLLEMLKTKQMSDLEMVQGIYDVMADANTVKPSIEALLHAIIPMKFVNHTHADSIVTISNSVDGDEHIVKLFPNFLIVDYVLPGFELAHKVYELTKNLDWDEIDGIILHNHGIFTFDDDAKKSYSKMIDAVSKAEQFLDENAVVDIEHKYFHSDCDIARVINTMSEYKGHEVHIAINQTPLASFYASQPNLREFASRGVLTPEHIVRTKRVPLIMEDTDLIGGIERYIAAYEEYFKKYASDETMLNPAPNYMIIKNLAVVSFGRTREEAKVIYEIVHHTMLAVLRADKLGGFKSISEQESFKVEYWKIKK